MSAIAGNEKHLAIENQSWRGAEWMGGRGQATRIDIHQHGSAVGSAVGHPKLIAVSGTIVGREKHFAVEISEPRWIGLQNTWPNVFEHDGPGNGTIRHP